jgi:hypothetical protein
LVKDKKKRFGQYLIADNNNMRLWLSNIDWHQEFAGLDIYVRSQKFCEILDEAVEQCVPLHGL